MEIEEQNASNSFQKTFSIHLLIWVIYLALQFVWRFDSYKIYDIIGASIQVGSWAVIFYTVRLYLYPKYLWKNHWKLASAFILVFPVFLGFTILYTDYIVSLKGDPAIPTIKYVRTSLFWIFNMSFVAFGFTYYDELGIQKERIKQIQLKLKDAELENLKAQFTPHFLFNTLWYIYALVQETGSEKATKAVELLSEMMRYSMKSRKVGEFVALEDELHYVDNFIELQRLRTPLLNLDYEVEKNLEGIKILPLVLMSFIENAFKHGQKFDAEFPIVVRLTIDENKNLSFFVKNKISQLGKERSSGIGLENVKSRLETAYGSNCSLKIINDEEFYVSELIINLKKQPYKP